MKPEKFKTNIMERGKLRAGYYKKGGKSIKLKYSDERLDTIENSRIAKGHVPGKKIEVNNNILAVSWGGNVINVATGEMLDFSNEGELKVVNIGETKLYLHKLLAMAWLGADEKSVVKHKDGDKSNNHVSNLVVV